MELKRNGGFRTFSRRGSLYFADQYIQELMRSANTQSAIPQDQVRYIALKLINDIKFIFAEDGRLLTIMHQVEQSAQGIQDLSFKAHIMQQYIASELKKTAEIKLLIRPELDQYTKVWWTSGELLGYRMVKKQPHNFTKIACGIAGMGLVLAVLLHQHYS